MYLLVTNDKLEILQSINNNHFDRKIVPIISNNNNLIIRDDLLKDCEQANNTWYAWKDWLLSLEITSDIPAIKPKPKINEK
jgi:hypothetical protein